ncbi:hypothetical protein BDR03DRAFT_1014967 [Suillus americanus]|nr:hypothetical protein BDR03DRAFT_1014967 [Suillus americanus]
MSVDNNMNIAAIPPAGYTDFLNTRINSQQFFSPPFDSSASHQTLYVCDQANTTPDSNSATPLVDTSTSKINSNITEVLSDNTTPPSIPSSTHAASLAVKVELVNHTKTTIAIDAKPDTIKKRQPSTKPMRVSAKITAQNLCALDWQSDSHQKEPASVFASYWNGLSKADKEVYKCKADAQLKSAGCPARHVVTDPEANLAWAPPLAPQTQNINDDLAGPESISLDKINAAFALLEHKKEAMERVLDDGIEVLEGQVYDFAELEHVD